MKTIHEPARAIDVVHECDLCVVGGSCTGVFAAVRAARLGAKVVLIERAGAFGGVATISMVNVWHSPLDAVYQREIIGGLTLEMVERLRRRDAIIDRAKSPAWAWAFNPFEMMIELDRIVLEHGIVPMLHTTVVAPVVVEGKIDAVIIENKSGRQAVRAKFFIDASGDADLAHRAGVPCYKAEHSQPSTTCAILEGWDTLGQTNIGSLIRNFGAEQQMPNGFAWGAPMPPTSLYMLAGTRVKGKDPSVADDLTFSEIEGRRQVRAIMNLVRAHAPGAKVTLAGLPARIGLRESRHIHARYQLSGDDVLHGKRFEDAIANGSYRVDIHHQDKPGITLRYLDGTESYAVPGEPYVQSRWREPVAVDPTFYQIPYRAMVPAQFPNLLCAGRMIDADPVAHAAIRVMVNMNQTGEAAGVASVLAMRTTGDVRTISVGLLRQTLAAGGSVIH